MKKNFKEVEEVENEIMVTEEVDFSEDIEIIDEITPEPQDIQEEKVKVSLEQFCEIATKTNIEQAIKGLELEVETYLPLRVKKILCRAVVNSIVYVSEGIKHYNVFDKDVLLAMTCISVYTNLDLNGSDSDNYDMLVKNNLLEDVLKLFPREYVECTQILEALLDEEVEQCNTVEAVLASSLNSLTPAINNLIDRVDPEVTAKYLGGGLEKVADLLQNSAGIKNMLDTFGKINKK